MNREVFRGTDRQTRSERQTGSLKEKNTGKAGSEEERKISGRRTHTE